MWLDDKRGNLIDWSTQVWVRATGRQVELDRDAWLAGPIGETRGIGPDFFDHWAAREGLAIERPRERSGVLPDFSALAGPSFDAAAVDPAVVRFYERSSDFEIDVWSEWSGFFRPFGWLVAAIFSRRLQQLNLPLSSLDTSRGMTSQVVRLTDPGSGKLRETAWVRSLVKTDRIIYVGCYSVAAIPGVDGPCVKTVIPLPNGNAIVLLRPRLKEDGSLELLSAGRRFGDAGFYFTVHRPDGRVVVRYLRQFRERIHVYRDASNEVRTDHTMSLWGLRCLSLHYRLRERSTAPTLAATR